MGDFTVQISNDLVDRILKNDENLKKKPRKVKPKAQKQPQKPQVKEDPKPVPDGFEKSKGPPSTGWPLQSPLFLPTAAPVQPAVAELEAIRSTLKESEEIVQRLENQEKNMLKEVTQRAKDLHDKEFKLPYQKPMPCLAENNACLECYKEHAKDPLKCASLVKMYADCARKARQQVSLGDR